MKILQVNCVYKSGSTGKITDDIHSALLGQGIASVVCYGRGKKVREEHVYKTCSEWYSKINHLFSQMTGVMYGGCLFSTAKLMSIIKREKPDIVHLQCINGYFVNIYRLVRWLKKNQIKTVLTLHAEFMYTGSCGHAFGCDKWKASEGCRNCPRWREISHSWFFDRTKTMWKRMKNAFDGFDDNLIVVSVSPWLMKRAMSSSILQGKQHQTVLNGLNTEIFHICDTANLKKKIGLDREKVIFHATPFFSLDPQHIKGGYYVNELAKQMRGQNVRFVVAGPYQEGIEVSDNLILLGKITDQTLLAQYYSMADVTLLTSRRETFSMVTAESLCCGTPVVGFLAGGPEEIAIPEYSSFTEYGNLDCLAQQVLAAMQIQDSKDFISAKARDQYAESVMGQNYVKIYYELMK